MTSRSLFLFAAFLFVACPSPVEPPAVDGGVELPVDGGAVDAGQPIPDAGVPGRQVTWTRCPLHTEGRLPWGECATLTVPLDAAAPNGPTIEVFVKRYKPVGGKSLRALWLLQGGPGASGYVFEGLSEQFATRFPDVDYYMPDHRGTGRSTRLECPTEEDEFSEEAQFISPAEWPDCRASIAMRYGTQLAAFNTTNAANDLGLLIDAARTPGQPTFVYGVSYGTYWLHRYLQLFPGQVDGVVFDSIAPPGTSLYRQDEDANEAARDFLAACASDTFCRGKLGLMPWAKAEALVAKLKAGHCSEMAVPGVATHVVLRRAFGSLLMDANLRAYIAPIIARVDRCEPRDVPALKVLMAQLTGQQPFSQELRLWGWVLSNNIIVSEFNETPELTIAQLTAIRDGAVASRDVTAGLELQLAAWPRYSPGPLASQWADSSIPMLFLQGGLDPATLLRKARVMKPHFTRPNQTWVELPTATHTTLVSSPFVNQAGERRSCGTGMLMRFIEAPTTPLDTSCVPLILPLDFTLNRPDVNMALFGTTDAWE